MPEHFKSSNWKLNWNFYDRHQAELEEENELGHRRAMAFSFSNKADPYMHNGLGWATRRIRIVCAHLTDNGPHRHTPILLQTLHINTVIMRFAFVKFPSGPVFGGRWSGVGAVMAFRHIKCWHDWNSRLTWLTVLWGPFGHFCSVVRCWSKMG